MRRGAVKSSLDGFLGTFTSRYTSWRGYWLFGFVVMQLDGVSIDLLKGGHDPGPFLLSLMAVKAREKFLMQLERNGVPRDRVLEARLDIKRSDELIRWRPGGLLVDREGYEVQFTAAATGRDGRIIERRRVVRIAPHDPRLERASWQWETHE